MDACLQKADIRLFQSCQPSADKLMDPCVTSILALSAYAEFGCTDTGKHVADPAALPTCFQTHVPSGQGPALLGSVPEHKEWTFVSCCHHLPLIIAAEGDNPLQTRKAVIHSSRKTNAF